MKIRLFNSTLILLACTALSASAQQTPGGKSGGGSSGGPNSSSAANPGSVSGTNAGNVSRSDAAREGGQLKGADEKFVLMAAQGGLLEVRLGELARQKGRQEQVKKFGEMMVADHGKANGELKTLAASKGLTLPGQLDAKHSAKVEQLSKLEGEAFDKAYLDEMVKDHERDVKEFEEASKDAKDADVKAFADRTLPTLRKHLEQVRGLHSKR